MLSTLQTDVVIFGVVNDSQRGDKITLTITYPDGTTNSEILTVTKFGVFQSFITLERNSLKGEYEISAFVKNQIIGITTFTVDPEIESNTNAGQKTICGKGTTYENGQCIIKSSDMGGCLIATTTYSSELASQVQFLREIRDTTLQSTTTSATFMMSFNQIYYSFSPVISDLERGNPIFADIIKLLITPMLSTLSLITLADLGSELEVMILGMIVIILNLTLYIIGPALIISKLYARVKNYNVSN